MLFTIPFVIIALFPDVYRDKCLMFTVLAYNTMLALTLYYIIRNRMLRVIVLLIILSIAFMNINHSIDNYYFFAEQEDFKGAADFLKQARSDNEPIALNVDYTKVPFLYYYNDSLFESAAKEIEPPELSKIIIILDPRVLYKKLINLSDVQKINMALDNVSSFWLVSYLYPKMESFSSKDFDFESISEREFGLVYVEKYVRK